MVTNEFSGYPKTAAPAFTSGGLSPPGIAPALEALANGRDTLNTDEAAKAINRAPQTLRKWACLENGPIRPIRIHGRLAWRVAELRLLLSGGTK